MPTYKFYDTKTGRHFEEFMSFTEVETFVKENPHIEWLPSLTAIGDPVRLGRIKPDNEFRDRLREIKKKHRGSKINTF